MSIKYMIIDDEPIAHDIILRFAKGLTHLEFQKSCYNPLEAVGYLTNHKVDLLFLDINMPHMKGLDFLKTLSNPYKVILTTAYKEYALEGYAFNVVDYLLKPFSLERFVSAIAKLDIQSPSMTHQAVHEGSKNSIFLKSDKKYYQIDSNDILYLEAMGSYIKVFTTKEMIVTHEKISDFELLLPNNFVRVHKSYVVSIKKIKTVEGNRIFIGDQMIPIGQTYKAELQKIIEE